MHVERTFPVELQSATGARRFVTEAMADAGLTDRVDDAELLTSELVANAVLHARTAFRVGVTVDDHHLRVTVHDTSPDHPVRQDPDPRETTGRGVLIVDALADRWGVEPDGNGKVVWFELDDPAAREAREA